MKKVGFFFFLEISQKDSHWIFTKKYSVNTRH